MGSSIFSSTIEDFSSFCISENKLLGSNSQIKLFQYFDVYLTDITMSRIPITISATTLVTALSKYQISYINIFQRTNVSKYNQIVLIFIFSELIQ
jgi:hypothetical protein